MTRLLCGRLQEIRRVAGAGRFQPVSGLGGGGGRSEQGDGVEHAPSRDRAPASNVGTDARGRVGA
jgi:hypothetical protein